MVVDSDRRLQEYLRANPEAAKEWEETHKLKHDPRVTKIGAFLRKTSLVNCLSFLMSSADQMSLVGPGPIGGGGSH